MRRPRRKKEEKPSVNAATITAKVFLSSYTDLKVMLEAIHTDQLGLTQSPNFFAQGQVFIRARTEPMHSLHESVRPKLKKYLVMKKHLDDLSTELRAEISKLIATGFTYSDLYYFFPENAHYFLEGVEPVERDEEYLEKISQTDCSNLHELLKEQMLQDLL